VIVRLRRELQYAWCWKCVSFCWRLEQITTYSLYMWCQEDMIWDEAVAVFSHIYIDYRSPIQLVWIIHVGYVLKWWTFKMSRVSWKTDVFGGSHSSAGRCLCIIPWEKKTVGVGILTTDLVAVGKPFWANFGTLLHMPIYLRPYDLATPEKKRHLTPRHSIYRLFTYTFTF